MVIPRSIVWVFTSICNLSCLHCYAAKFRLLNELSIEDKLKLVKEFANLGIEYVSLTGGEPLIHRDTPEIVRMLADYGIEVSVVTNGTVTSDEKLRMLAKYSVSVYVSLDGPRVIHDRIRSAGVFDKVMEFLTKARELGIRFGTVMAVSTINYTYAKQYIEIASRFEPSEIAMIPVMPVGRARILGIYVNHLEYMFAVRQALEKAQEIGIPIHLWCSPFVGAVIKSPSIVAYGCRTLDVVDIDPAGRILLCDTIDLAIASIRREGSLSKALEVYSSSSIVKNVIEPKLPEPCSSCEQRSLCRGGCFSRAYALSGDLNAGDPLCPLVAESRNRRCASCEIL